MFQVCSSDSILYTRAHTHFFQIVFHCRLLQGTEEFNSLCYVVGPCLSIFLFLFGCAGSLLLRGLFCGCGKWGLLSQLQRAGFSLQWLLLQSTGSRAASFSRLQHAGSVAAAPGLLGTDSVVALRLSCPTACVVFLDWGPNPCLLHWPVDSLPLSRQGRPLYLFHMLIQWGLPGGTVVKNSPVSAGDTRDAGSIPGSERFPGGGNDNPLQYSCRENSMDRGAWQATVHGVAKSQTRCWYSTVYLLISDSWYIPPLPFPFDNYKFCFVNKLICIPFLDSIRNTVFVFLLRCHFTYL